MRKVFLCALLGLGFMNLCFGQVNVNSERVSIRKYNEEGIAERFTIVGEQALNFDIIEYIKENDDVERLVINGAITTNFSSQIFKFDSDVNKENKGDYLCKDLDSKRIPFLGVYGTGTGNNGGADIKRIIPGTAAEKASLSAQELITSFNGQEINNFKELRKAVLSSEIGSRVQLGLDAEDKKYSRTVTVGFRGIETETYSYCAEEQIELTEESNLRNVEEASFSAYPNPTSSVSQVKFSSESKEDVTFSVTDITGRLLHKEVFTNFNGELNLDYSFDGNQSGSYILHIQQGEEIYNRKVQLIKK